MTILISGFTLCMSCKPSEESKSNIGIVKTVLGKPVVIRQNSETNITKGQIILAGDVVRTQKEELVTIVFKSDSAFIEIQGDAQLEISKYLQDQKEMNLQRGNAWLQVNKQSASETFLLKTPTSIAAVRGTKFYTFQMPGGIVGTCHCEGEVDFSNTKTEYKSTHHKHDVVFTRNGKTALVTQEEALSVNWPVMDEHQHSKLDESVVGKKEIKIPPAVMNKYMQLVEKKFAEAKN